ncbi:MAG: ankyrin repeat domain-containing protein [Armatimonadota bacterium]
MRSLILTVLMLAALLAACAEPEVLVMNGQVYVPLQSVIEALGGKATRGWRTDEMPTFVLNQRELPALRRETAVMRDQVVYVALPEVAAQCPFDVVWDGAASRLTIREPKTGSTLILPQGEVLTFPSSPIHDAAQHGDADRLRQLIEDAPYRMKTADPQQRTPLHWASALGRLEAVQVLLENKASVDALALGRVTPLEEAVAMAQPAVVKALITAGADIQRKTSKGSLLHAAVTHPGNLEVVKLLVDKGLDVNAKSHAAGPMPLHLAVTACHEDIIAFLIEHGADIKNTGQGWSPLQLAAFAGNAGAVNALLEAGAGINDRGVDGRTPLKMALDGAKDPAVLNLLRQQGGTEQ